MLIIQIAADLIDLRKEIVVSVEFVAGIVAVAIVVIALVAHLYCLLN